MKTLTISQRIIGGFAAIVVVSLALGIYCAVQLRTISTVSAVTTVRSLEGMSCVVRIESAAHENNVLLLRDLMTKNEDLKTDLEGQIQTNLARIASIAAEYRGGGAPGAFDTAREEYAGALTQVLQLSREAKNQQAMELKQDKVDKFLGIIQAEERLNKDNGDKASLQVQKTARATQISIAASCVLLLIVAIGVSWAISGGINRVLGRIVTRLNDGARQVTVAAQEVSSASQSLANASSEQAASIEETSSSLEEMSSMTRHNSENAQKANDLAKQTRAAADQGVADMQSMNTAMLGIKTSSDDIAKIIKAIDEIAFQTNILALNAAVEAARAGEAGMGFAVVADEVRNLAQRSAQAAKETASKIEGAIGKTAQGVELSGTVATALNDIAQKAREVDQLVAEVSTASNEQSQGVLQISAAVTQMDKATQTNAATAEESAAASEALNAQSTAMKESVAELLHLVGGAKANDDASEKNPRPASPRKTAPATQRPGSFQVSTHESASHSLN